MAMADRLGAPIVTTRYAEQALVAVPPRSSKFTREEWKMNNDMRRRNTEDQQQLADRILADSQHVIAETCEKSCLMQSRTEKLLEERIGDVEFNKNELMRQRTQIGYELESLGMMKVRLQDALASLKSNALTVCQKCLMLRDGRQGIDLVVDDVEIALEAEIRTILYCQSLLTRALEQIQEQMRRLRSTRYLLDRDLQNKQDAIEGDKQCLYLQPSHLCLSVYEGYANLDPSNISATEYDVYSVNNIKRAAQEVNGSRSFKSYVDQVMKQTLDDLWAAYRKCNRAFNESINNTKALKAKYEDMHNVTSTQIIDMKTNILNLQKALTAKECQIGLAHTRLGKRSQRRELELVRDPACQSLLMECDLLRNSVGQLQLMLYEATASLRYLLQTQIQMEEDINVKMNTLKINEVDCMTLRLTMEYHKY